VLDPTGIAISTAASWQASPAVAFDGANSLVVWHDLRSGSSADIYGARVTPQGTVLDPQGFVISQAANDPALCFDGANFLVVWEDGRNGSSIYGARVSRDGTVLDPTGVAISIGTDYRQNPSASCDGTDFLVVWADGRNDPDAPDVYGARLSPAGSVLDEFPVVTQEGHQGSPTLARGPGSQMFLVYMGWAGTIGGKAYNTFRIWGKMNPVPGVEERENSEVRGVKGGATIIRGVLNMGQRLMADGSRPGIGLYDANGRKTMALRPGPNDISGLAPGFYFVRRASSVHKVVITG
jgi:hypothetical protein